MINGIIIPNLTNILWIIMENNVEISPPAETASQPAITGGIDLLRQAWEIFKRLWKKLFLLIFAAPLIFSLIASGLAIIIGLIYLPIRFFVYTPSQGAMVLTALNVFFITAGCLVFIVPILIGFMLAYFSIIFILDNNELSARDAFNKSLSYFWRYLWLIIIHAVIILIALVLLVGPGVFLLIAFIFSGYVLALENIGGWQALRRSRELVRGFWWTILARLLLAWLIGFVFLTVINIIVRLFSLLILLPVMLLGGISQNPYASSGASLGSLILLALVVMLVLLIVFIVSLASSFVVQLLTIIYHFLLYKQLQKIKADNPQAKDKMSANKKVGLALVFIVPPIILVIIFIIVMSLISTFKSVIINGQSIGTSTIQLMSSSTWELE